MSLITLSLHIISHPAHKVHTLRLPSLLDPISIMPSLEASLSALGYLWVSSRCSSRGSTWSTLHLDFHTDMASIKLNPPHTALFLETNPCSVPLSTPSFGETSLTASISECSLGQVTSGSEQAVAWHWGFQSFPWQYLPFFLPIISNKSVARDLRDCLPRSPMLRQKQP